MKRNVIAIVTGYTKTDALNKVSFEQLRKLRSAGVIDRIIYVSWDSPRLDDLFSTIAKFPDIEIMRVPEPKIEGAPLQKSIIYQIRNLEAALQFINDDDALILKTRPDFVFANEDFIKQKILDFDKNCAPSDLPKRLKLQSPKPIFERKIWVPWASASEPLFISDAVFLGLKRDIDKLADRAAEPFLEILWDERCDRISHICRFLNIFQNDYPLLRKFGQNIRYFISTLDYRDYFAFFCRKQPFFWRLAVLNAWLLETHFHIDGGHNGDLIFCSHHANLFGKITTIKDIKFEPPLTTIDLWRKNITVGSLKVCCEYSVTVLADDRWQHALFTRSRIDNFSHSDIIRILKESISYDPKTIKNMEADFYNEADRIYKKYITDNPGVLSDDGVIEHPSRSRKLLEEKRIAEALRNVKQA